MGLLDRLFGPPSKKKFARLLVDGLLRAGDTRKATFDHNEFQLVFSQEDENLGVLNLANLYLEFCSVPKNDRPRCLKEMVRAALSHLKELPDEFPDASYDIRPRLWTRATFEQIRLQQEMKTGEPVDWPLEPIGQHLFLSLVFDLPEAVRSISNDDLKNWGVTYWEAREVAVNNLNEANFVFASLGDELFASNTGDSYDATRLIMVDIVRQLNIKGQPVAMVPNRDTLLLTGTESEVGQKMMLEFAMQQLREAPRPLIATPLILSADDQWLDWLPEPDNPLYREYREIRLGWLQNEYDDQKQMLEKLFDMQQLDEFVASFTVVENGENIQSYSVWSKGVVTQLPKTDMIFFFDPESENRWMVNWSVAERVVSHFFEPMDRYPERFRVTEFPTTGQLAEMDAELKT